MRIEEMYELERLKKYIDEHGIPKFPEYSKLSKKGILRSPSYYYVHFGGLKKVYELIGVKKSKKIYEKKVKSNKIPEEKGLEMLKNYCEKHGVVPTSLEVKKNFRSMGVCSYQYYKDHFGSWKNVLKLIGQEK